MTAEQATLRPAERIPPQKTVISNKTQMRAIAASHAADRTQQHARSCSVISNKKKKKKMNDDNVYRAKVPQRVRKLSQVHNG